MPLTEAKANRVIPWIYSDLFTIVPQASLSLATNISSLSLNPLPISNSFTSSLHLLYGLALPFYPSLFLIFPSPFFPHARTISTRSLHYFQYTQLTPLFYYSVFYYAHYPYATYASLTYNLKIVPSPVHLITTFPNHIQWLVSLLFHITFLLLSIWICATRA